MKDFMTINNYYFHTILKDNKESEIYNNFEQILKDGKLKSQRLLHNNEIKFNGLDYISLASFVEPSEYKVFVVDKKYYNMSKLSNIFTSYNHYLEYLKLNNRLEEPLNKEQFFKKYNTNNKRDYYNYLDTISRTYPVDINYLYKITNDIIYKYILDLIGDDILYCNKSEYCFEEYVKNSNGITFIFPKTIDIIDVRIIPNLPFEIESKLVKKAQNLYNRYSNQIGEVQVKDYLDINSAVGIIINDNINKKIVFDLLKKYNLNLKIYKMINEQLIEL